MQSFMKRERGVCLLLLGKSKIIFLNFFKGLGRLFWIKLVYLISLFLALSLIIFVRLIFLGLLILF